MAKVLRWAVIMLSTNVATPPAAVFEPSHGCVDVRTTPLHTDYVWFGRTIERSRERQREKDGDGDIAGAEVVWMMEIDKVSGKVRNGTRTTSTED